MSYLPILPLTLPLTLLSSLTDYVDGSLARLNPRWSTVLGSYLDPFADKVFVGGVAASLWWVGGVEGRTGDVGEDGWEEG